MNETPEAIHGTSDESMTAIDVVRTERLRLEPVTMDDVVLHAELDSDPEVMQYITGGKPTPQSELVEIIRGAIGNRWIARDAAEEFVGWFSLPARGPREAELGYRLRRTMWGNGYASEGARAVIEFGFDRLGLDRIWAQTMTVNDRSRRVMEACGMTFVRTFHLDWPETIAGTEHGDVEYEIRRPQR